MELINLLTEKLGIDAGQAEGGAGLLFNMAKEKLGNQDFAQVAEHVPGIQSLLDKAPASGGGLGGALGGLASSLGGGNIAGLASLAGGFSKLGLDAGMISQFVPVILQFVQQKGGDGVKGLLQKVLE